MTRNAFQRAVLTATILVLALIFIGGLVRATGAGLGCPDWPRCWGSWWPPASVEEIDLANLNPAKIPAEYRDAADPRVFFNKGKMWIEYLNRLWGVLAGFAVIATVLTAIPWAKKRPAFLALSVLILAMMLFQGWLGALVVRSGLKQNMITIHMAMAMAILGLLVYTTFLAHGTRRASAATPHPMRRRLAALAAATLTLTLIQIFSGTHVREGLDHIADTMPELPRHLWLAQVGITDHFHRAFSWTIVFTSLILLATTARHARPLLRRATLAFGLVATQVGLGISLAYFALPPASQFLHLGVATCLATVLLWILLDTTGSPDQTSGPRQP